MEDKELDQLRAEIRTMKPKDKLYKLLKSELTRLGLWGFNYEKLKQGIHKMQRWNKLYKVLKVELSKVGYWKNKERGNPKQGFLIGMGKNKGR